MAVCVLCIYRAVCDIILGECLLLSSLPGKALRTLVDIESLVNLISKDGTWYFIYQFIHCFTLETSDYD